MKKIGAKATVVISVEVILSDRWGGDCNIEQLHSQAKTGAVDKLQKLFHDNINSVSRSMRIIGEPQVTGILTEEQG